MSSQFTIPLILAIVAAGWFAIAATVGVKDPGTRKLGVTGGVLALAMCVAVIVVQVAKVKIQAPVAIPLLVATIVEFGFIIAMTGRLLRGRVPQGTFTFGVLAIIAGILVGVVLMFQPLTPKVFNLGFDFVLIALLAFNVWSHITPKRGRAVQEQAPEGH